LKLATEITEGTEKERKKEKSDGGRQSGAAVLLSFSVPSVISVAKQKNKERPFNLSFRRLALLG